MKDENFKHILLEKEHDGISRDFESDMMQLIHKHASGKVTERKYIRLMYLFFLLGLMLGIVIAVSLADKEFTVFGYQFIINRLVLQIPLVIAILVIFEKIYKATLVSRGKEDFTSV